MPQKSGINPSNSCESELFGSRHLSSQGRNASARVASMIPLSEVAI